MGKHPRVRTGLHSATTGYEQLNEWWTRWPRSNIGLRTGAASGLVVVDIDPEHGGSASFEDLVRHHGRFPEGHTVATGGGGVHLYFAHPGRVVRNDAGRALGAGIDIRGDGGYVIAPPSLHRSGRRYEPANGCHELPQLPDWLLERLEPRPEPTPASRGHVIASRSAWARAAVEGEIARLATAREGTRNDTLNRVAFRLGQALASTRDLDERAVADTLIERAVGLGLSEREARTTAWSGLAAGSNSASCVDGGP